MGSVMFPRKAVSTTVRIAALAIFLFSLNAVWYIAKPMAGMRNRVVSIWPEAR